MTLVLHGGVTVTKEFFKMTIDLPSFQLELSTADPLAALPELRRVLEALKLDDQLVYEEFVAQEIRQTFSRAFTQNTAVMDAIRELLKQAEDYKVVRTTIPSKTTIDLEQDSKSVHITRRDVKDAVSHLAARLLGSDVKQGIIHVSGSLGKDDKLLILDHIHKHMPTAQLRAFESGGPKDKVLVECIFFGDFPGQDEE